MSLTITIYSIVIILISVYLLLNKMSIFKVILHFFGEINQNYYLFYKSQNTFLRLMLIAFISIYMILSILTVAASNNLTGPLDGLIKLIFAIFIFYIVFGIPFLIIRRIKDAFSSEDMNKILWLFMLNFSFIYLFSVYSFMMPRLHGATLIILTALMISYIINMRLLLLFITQIKTNRQPGGTPLLKNNKQIYIGAIFLILALVFNLYLNVYTVHSHWVNAYMTSSPKPLTSFDLLYYTVITFTTIGYGDIAPTLYLSKFYAIQIAITSVVCLVVFVNSLLNIND